MFLIGLCRVSGELTHVCQTCLSTTRPCVDTCVTCCRAKLSAWKHSLLHGEIIVKEIFSCRWYQCTYNSIHLYTYRYVARIQADVAHIQVDVVCIQADVVTGAHEHTRIITLQHYKFGSNHQIEEQWGTHKHLRQLCCEPEWVSVWVSEWVSEWVVLHICRVDLQYALLDP